MTDRLTRALICSQDESLVSATSGRITHEMNLHVDSSTVLLIITIPFVEYFAL